MVNQILAMKLLEGGHAIKFGTRDVSATLAKDAPNRASRLTMAQFLAQHPGASLGTFAEATALGEVILSATHGLTSIDALKAAGNAADGKIVIDISNPLDFSTQPPTLLVKDTDSLGEMLQRAITNAKVVKTLNTVTAAVMANPRAVADGDHTMFVCGNDEGAKVAVTGYLVDWFGWQPSSLIDLGDITNACRTEMLLPVWLRLWGKLGTGMFSLKVVR
jgi:predicted dinucleotide-binding enzyme